MREVKDANAPISPMTMVLSGDRRDKKDGGLLCQ